MSVPEMAGGDRRTGTKEIVDKLLSERQDVLVRYCQIAGLEPYTPGMSLTEALQDFCQVLVDYSAFGHFEIYQRIVDGDERRESVIQVAEEVYDRIAEASEVAVAFNDRYDSGDHELDLSNLSDDLSLLGEEIAQRIEMEDRIISALTS